jgi:aspartyl-tRNA synthetase
MERIHNKETAQMIGQKVKLAGWVHNIRFHGKIVFIDLRDETGLIQAVATPECQNYQESKQIRPEWVIEIEGQVNQRPEKMINPNINTGQVEIEITKINIVSQSKTPPFEIEGDGLEINEELRLKYRYLDLRRNRLQRNIRIRSEYVQAVREFLFKKEFVEIETPLFTKSTPEGSRDFVVPSRMYPGKFFALPQSPQQYKQLLMMAGFEKYFQIARALRDEDLRSYRTFEHTQIDLEMSFVDQEKIMKTIEEMTVYGLEKINARIKEKPFPVITYAQAMEKYGADKFDLRTEKEKEEGILSFCWVIDFPFFEKTKENAWTFTHNPFSAPLNQEHEDWLIKKKNIDKIITSQFDLVCNGLEVSGGSVRAHKPQVLEATFEILGYSKDKINKDFGHMMEALSFGAPPHGGCAQGFERLLMAFLGEDYLREVQAFPQTGQGRTSVMDAPSELSSEQLKELGLTVNEKKK